MKVANLTPRLVLLAFGLFMLGAAAPVALAATNSWITARSGKWETATNWSLGIPPASTQWAFITNAGADLGSPTNSIVAKQVTIDGTTSGSFPSTLTVSNVTIFGAGTNVANFLSISNTGASAPLHILDQMAVGTGGFVGLTTNGSLQVDGLLSIGAPPPAGYVASFPASFGLSAGSAQVADAWVGPVSNSFGGLNIGAGTLWITNSLLLGASAGGSTGSVGVVGGILIHTNNTMVIGASGFGTFAQGGGAVLAQSVLLGRDAGAEGTLFLSGGTFSASERLEIGTNGSALSGAVFVFTNGTLYVTNPTHTAYLNMGPNGALWLQGGLAQVDNLLLTNGGTYYDYGGTLVFTKPFHVENGSTVNVNGGTTTAASDFTMGAVTNSTGTLLVQNGGALNVVEGTLGIGNDGTLTNGTGVGTATVDGAALNVATLNLGSSAGGLGNLQIQSANAAVSVLSNITVVSGSLSSPSLISISDGALIATNGMVAVGPTGSGQLLISGGNHVVRQIRLGSTNGAGTGLFHLSGGSVRILGNGTGPGAGLDCNLWTADGGDLDGTGTSITVGEDGHSAEAYVSCFGQCTALYMGAGTNCTGTYTQTGGVMVVYSNLVVGDNCVLGTNGGQGLVNFSGGTIYVTNASHSAVLEVRNGKFNLNAGATLVVDNLLLTNPCAQFATNGGTILSSSGPNAATFRITSIALTNQTDVRLDWTTMGGQSYAVQTNGKPAGGQFRDLSGVIAVAGTGPGSTNYVHSGGATNGVAYYRVRQLFTTANLLLNPGAETGDLSDWTPGGTNPPSVISGSFSAIQPHSGNYEFNGGSNYGALTQAVLLAGIPGLTVSNIDSGQVRATVSFWEQGFDFGTGLYDDGRVTLVFLNGNGTMLNAISTPELDSHSGMWGNYTGQYPIPAGTRSINYIMEFISRNFIFDDVFIDDNYLTITGP